ncbi:MAG: pirin family protein [Candidatus Firestonebacteria bacterium]|nr:pirin family protein [Candidatus Firestonebacteria bacterium]
MSQPRSIQWVHAGQMTQDGAGVKLSRAFSNREAERMDPFLLLDDFRSNDPSDYLAGFPWHPHRGIETITYMLSGRVEHRDSMGNQGVIGAGDVQWMTAGSGIIHQEMPQGDKAGSLGGFQLWTNLPARLKLTPPKYREIKSAMIPRVPLPQQGEIRVICGRYGKTVGPVADIAADPMYLDVHLSAGESVTVPVEKEHTVVAYVVEGRGRFGAAAREFERRTVVLFNPGKTVAAQAGKAGLRFLLLSGRPLHEPIAWGGPIVMNTQAELELAFQEYRDGAFIKHG